MKPFLVVVLLTLLFPRLSGEEESHFVLLKALKLQKRVEFLEGKKSTEMVASWYGPRFHGKKRADGKRYNMYDSTVVAHRILPFGTRLKLENPENSRRIVVAIRDRGPYWPGRHLDLSYKAAEKLGIIEQGVAVLKVTVIR